MLIDTKTLAGSKAYVSSLLAQSNEFVFIKLADLDKNTAPAMVVAIDDEVGLIASLAFLFTKIPHFRSAVLKALTATVSTAGTSSISNAH